MVFTFKASNYRTYKIDFEFGFPNRFYLGIINGKGLYLPDYNDEDGQLTTGIAPGYSNNKIDWNYGDFYSDANLKIFVPLDLKMFCEKLVSKLFLM